MAMFQRLFVSASKNHVRYLSSSSWIEENHPLFRRAEVRKNIWVIEERFFDSWNKANIFYIKGTKQDLLIDSGMGLYNLSTYLTLTGLKDQSRTLDLVLTHTHFDHSGGAHHFDDPLKSEPHIFVHSLESRNLLSGKNRFRTAAWVTPQEIIPKPYRSWDSKSYHVAPVTKVETIDEGHVFDLGNYKFQVLHLPGHTCGSIALFDKQNGVLATGDTLYNTEEQLIDWYVGGSSVSAMYKSVKRIRDLLPDVKTVLPGHNEVLNGQQALVAADNYLKLANGQGRRLKKAFSRLRAGLLIGVHSRGYYVPEFAREWIKN